MTQTCSILAARMDGTMATTENLLYEEYKSLEEAHNCLTDLSSNAVEMKTDLLYMIMCDDKAVERGFISRDGELKKG